MHPILNVAIHAAKIAGKLIIQYYNYDLFNKKTIQENKIIISKITKKAEKLITKTIYKFYPQHVILNNQNKKIKKKIYWVINPINGIHNFIKNFPYFVISISVHINNNTEVAVIYEPICNEMFTCIRGRGAQLNGYRLRIGTTRNIHAESIAISFFIKEKKTFFKYINLVQKLFLQKNIKIFRSIGSTILELAYVAAGRIDGFLQTNLNCMNTAGAILLIQEAGGLIIDFWGTNNYVKSRNIIAGNPYIVKFILHSINT
ncbi:MAG: inositol-phosphate phosphatase [Candidatus Westeberhardia cardiocondylae]|nr:inositol-phosphate phosphatase [Candidatus Westeberhardia cardiocondylae]